MKDIKKAIITTLAFLTTVCLLCVGVMEFYFVGENDYFQDSDARNALAGSLDYLIIGASHAQRSFNPAILDEELGVNSYNLGAACLTMKARCDLLKKEMERNPVETVVLEVSFDAIRVSRKDFGDEGDLYYMARIDSLPRRIGFFFHAFYPGEYVSAFQYFMKKGVNSAKLLLKGKYMMTYHQETSYKGFKKYERESQDQSIDYARYYKTVEADVAMDEENIEYFEKLVQLCKDAGVKIVMIMVPVTEAQISRTTGFDTVREWYVDFAAAHDIDFYDFNLLKNRDELFSDQVSFVDKEHLGNEGMDVFTEIYIDLMKRREAGEDIQSYFLNSYRKFEETRPYYPGP